MMKPSIPQGTRDFGPEVIYKRQHIFNTIRRVFELYGFQPLETPSMENLSTLMGKYGEEGDRLIFKILNNGLSDPNKADKVKAGIENILKGRNDIVITERALRYDLTIPFARYVVMNHGTLAFPFKRFQMQPVWRADRPQRGRYREFWQCDADVVGSNSLINEAELLSIYSKSFTALRIPGIRIKINNRKILAALAETLGKEDRFMDLTIAIDKLDKIGIEKVSEELRSKGFTGEDISLVSRFLGIRGNNEEKLDAIQSLLGERETGLKGMNELREILRYYEVLNPDSKDVDIDFTLARGLNYYTGMITEVATDAVVMGSLGGGGRYDDLTGLFGLKYMSGVGISFGVDRIYDVMEELELFPEHIKGGASVIFLSYTKEAESDILQYMNQLRSNDIPAEYYTEMGKMEKQLKYVNRRGIPYTAIIGGDELNGNYITLKNMQSGEQRQLSIAEVIDLLKKQ